jgi:hypothetical protein
MGQCMTAADAEGCPPDCENLVVGPVVNLEACDGLEHHIDEEYAHDVRYRDRSPC